MNRRIFLALLALCITITVLTPTVRPGATASASSFFFTTGEPDGRMAAASRPESRHKIEIEAADDFILTSQTIIDRATFTGLLFHGGHGEIRDVAVEIYRVFPQDSDTARTPRCLPERTRLQTTRLRSAAARTEACGSQPQSLILISRRPTR